MTCLFQVLITHVVDAVSYYGRVTEYTDIEGNTRKPDSSFAAFVIQINMHFANESNREHVPWGMILLTSIFRIIL